MKLSVLIFAATLGLAIPAFAETPSPDPAPPAAAGPTDAAPREKVKELRQACRAQVKGQGLKGEDRMKAVSDCVVKERPDLAQREQCRMDGRAKGLRKEELKAFVKDCTKSKG